MRNHESFVRRTYMRNNYTSVRNYRVGYWGHHRIYSYVPYRVYSPRFYGWCGHSWGPTHFAWWWYDDPWYPYYGYYWHPYPVYYGPSFWLTDFVIADILSEAYAEERAENVAQARAASYAAIDDRIKAQVRVEVEAELKARRKQSSVPVDQTLKTGYMHVITKDMDVAAAGSSDTCTLSSGDIVKISNRPSKEDQVVEMAVVTSKRGGCSPNKHILVSLDDLQDMKNHFSETVDKGLEKLHDQEGKGGIPPALEADQSQPQDTISPEEKAQAVQEARDASEGMSQ